MKKKPKIKHIHKALADLAPGISSFKQLDDMSLIDTLRKTEAIKEVVYELPYPKGKGVVIIQGYNGLFSHRGENALDFWMRKGKIICAARGGIVKGTKSNSKIGGSSSKHFNDGNYVIIKHDDSTAAAYWHMEYDTAMVKSGDTVVAGQPIGKVGSTGMSTSSHLHFEVFYFDKDGQYLTLETLFNTTRGTKKLKAWHFYRRPKEGKLS